MTGKIRGILRERRGIALASVMIIFIVSAILVTGISTAVLAQANIIRSREKASQAHYYAYSAADAIKTALYTNGDAVPSQLNVPTPISVSGLIKSGENASITSATLTKIWEDADTAQCLLSVTAQENGKQSTVNANVFFDKVDNESVSIEKQLLYTNLTLGSNTYIRVGDETYKGVEAQKLVMNSNYGVPSIPQLNFYYTPPSYTPPIAYDSTVTNSTINYNNTYNWSDKDVIFTPDNVSINYKKSEYTSNSDLVFDKAKSVSFQDRLFKLQNSVIYAPLCNSMSFENGIDFNNIQLYMMGTNTLSFKVSIKMKNTVIFTNAKSVIITNPTAFENVKLYAPNATSFEINTTTQIKNSLFYLPEVTNYNITNNGTFVDNTRIYAPKASISYLHTNEMDGIFYFKNFEYSINSKLSGIFYITDTFKVNYWQKTSLDNLKGALLTNKLISEGWDIKFNIGDYDPALISNYLAPNSEFSFAGGVGGGSGSNSEYIFNSMTYTKAN
ncbi:MAG: hypothetical protein AB9835_08370 [Eubacteriales bacterium]